jgi:hypothetical protein
MKAKKSAKPTMAQAFNAAQGAAVARPNGKGNGQGPAVARPYDMEDSDKSNKPMPKNPRDVAPKGSYSKPKNPKDVAPKGPAGKSMRKKGRML